MVQLAANASAESTGRPDHEDSATAASSAQSSRDVLLGSLGADLASASVERAAQTDAYRAEGCCSREFTEAQEPAAEESHRLSTDELVEVFALRSAEGVGRKQSAPAPLTEDNTS